MGISDDTRRRLEALNGGPLRYAQKRADAGAVKPAGRRVKTTRRRGTITLDEAVAGMEVYVPSWGSAYRIETPVRDMGDVWANIAGAFHEALAREDGTLGARLAHLHVAGLSPEDVLFVDLETTGLSYTPLFLIGTLIWEAGELVVRQYLARDYDEEAAVMALFLDHAIEKRLLISFNGKSFDVPYLRARATYYGLPYELKLPHLDLLHESRRAWWGTVPNHRLQTLEQHVCGHPERAGDIPSAQIPTVYAAYVRTGDARLLAQVLRHNALDLITVAELMVKLP